MLIKFIYYQYSNELVHINNVSNNLFGGFYGFQVQVYIRDLCDDPCGHHNPVGFHPHQAKP